jgi:hypothetical protein
MPDTIIVEIKLNVLMAWNAHGEYGDGSVRPDLIFDGDQACMCVGFGRLSTMKFIMF